MGKRVVDDASMSRVADAMRAKTGKTEALIFPDGFAGGVDEVFAAGEKSGAAQFWDSYQQNGNRTDYSTAFGGQGWTTDNFKPKYNLMVINAYMMFRNSTLNIDLPKYLESLGVSLDFSQAQSLQYAFMSSQFARVGVIDTRSSTTGVPLDSTFNNCTKLIAIDKVILSTGDNGQFTGTFNNCSSLVHVTFEGAVERNGLNLQWSTKLSKSSIENIINVLSNTTSGLTVTLSKTAKEAAFTAEEWAVLIATKPNWTVSLV